MRKYSVRPVGRSINDPPLWVKALKAIGATALTLLLAGLVVLIILEWFAGCGETYVDSNGERHANECLFLPYYK